MKRPNRLMILLAGVFSAVGSTAWAEDATPAPAGAPAAAPAPMEHKFTGDKEAFFISGGVSDSTTWTIGTTLPQGVTISVGLNINYNGNGLPGPTGTPTTDKFAFTGVLYGAYYIYNKFPVGIAAEAAIVQPLSPSNTFTIIQPGIGIFYAPFPAPIVLGSGLDLQITIPKGGSTIVQTVTPGVRIVYVF